MSDKVRIELGSVQRTLLLPLWGRAVETQKRNPLLVDNTAVEIIGKIDYDFSTIDRNINPVTQMAWIARSLHIDRAVKRFLHKHPKASFLNLGCGLDTTFERVDNGTLVWFDLDLPDVIALRKNFVAENKRRKFLASSMLDESWFDRVNVEEGVMFIAAGVLYYFEEHQLRKLFSALADAFPGSELVFDACSPLGVRVANEKVIKSGGMDENSILKWGLVSTKDLCLWDKRIRVVDEYRLFRGMRASVGLGGILSDVLNIMSMVHLQFAEEK